MQSSSALTTHIRHVKFQLAVFHCQITDKNLFFEVEKPLLETWIFSLSFQLTNTYSRERVASQLSLTQRIFKLCT